MHRALPQINCSHLATLRNDQTKGVAMTKGSHGVIYYPMKKSRQTQ